MFTSEIVDLGPFLFVFLLLRFETFLVPDELLLHEQVVFDSVQLQKSEPTFSVWSYEGKLRSGIRTLEFTFIYSHPSSFFSINVPVH
jgi:hypothetical protein